MLANFFFFSTPPCAVSPGFIHTYRNRLLENDVVAEIVLLFSPVQDALQRREHGDEHYQGRAHARVARDVFLYLKLGLSDVDDLLLVNFRELLRRAVVDLFVSFDPRHPIRYFCQLIS